jgi:RNA polymerase sigma-70 factor (ECF subfamily)
MESIRAVENSAPGGPPPLIDDEATLWPKAAQGDVEAADALARCTYRAVYASLFRLCGGNEDLAADLTQETYRKAWRSIGSFKGGSKFSTWLYRIAYNTFLNHIRGPRRLEPLTEEQVDQLLDPSDGPDVTTSRSAEAERLRRAVLDLPEELRFAVTARFWAELSVTEIANYQGLSAVGVRKRLKRAYKQLATTLEGELQ